MQEIETTQTPESLVEQLEGEPGVVLLKSGASEGSNSCYSFVTASPFVTLRSIGTSCELQGLNERREANPWQVMAELMARFKIEESSSPFPLGGCFGYWGYDLKNFVEPTLPRRAVNDLQLPDCHLGFYDSLVAFDHRLGKTWIISTGMEPSGARSLEKASEHFEFWRRQVVRPLGRSEKAWNTNTLTTPAVNSNLSRSEFLSRVQKAQNYIRSGDIYQVNLSQRLTTALPGTSWEFFKQLAHISPAPFSAFFNCGDFQLCSSSPELFLRMQESQIETQPIKGTRPRSSDPLRDAQLSCELQTSAKERAELVMITDLLRNDLGKVCEYGSIEVPELARLERFSQIQHLISTVKGRLQKGRTHLSALESCFPGGSITGAPKIRAMQIIDELEPLARGPYTGAIGYLGFNRQSQLGISIRTAICKDGNVHFHVGAGIVADSVPEAEYDETLAKGAGFLAALKLQKSLEKVIFLNGQWVSEEQAVISVFDRGFLYGDGLFETLRVENGVPLRWESHFTRLQRGLDLLKLKIPFTEAQLRDFASQLVVRNETPRAILRLTISRGVGLRGYSPKSAKVPSVMMTLHPAPAIDSEKPKCWRLVTSAFRLQKGDPLSQFKHANKLPQILARTEADEAGAEEALLLNTEGELAEGTASNLFWIKDGEIFTPALDCGVLPGITRQRVIDQCHEKGLLINEVYAARESLLEADGVFMTLTTLGIVEVISLDGHPLKRSELTGELAGLLGM